MLMWIKSIVCVIAGFCAYWLGGIDTILICLMALIVVDYLTGVLQAIYNKCLSSDIGFKGIVRKVLMLLIVAVSFIIETATNGAFAIREIVIMFFIANEGISLLENASKCGVPFPNKLIEVLKQLKGESEENGSENH